MNLTQTQQVAQTIAKRLQQSNGGVVFLDGPMGAGKTTLVAEIVKCLDPDAHPCSPTFAIINQYRDTIYHADLYRLCEKGVTATQAADEIGLWDLCGPGNYVFIEWPGDLAYPQALRIKISVKEDGTREFVIA